MYWIFTTTPLITLALSIAGVWYVLRYAKNEMHKVSVFILLWFLIPIIRVSLPRTVIYGGVRQIMEYIPPMAILSGIGARWFVQSVGNYFIIKQKITKKKQKNFMYALQIIVILSFVPIAIKMIAMHPNESIYFNSLIGGLSGAAEKNIPGWGNSLGSTYRQGVNWINEHAEENAGVTLIYELRSNIALSEFRPDLFLNNQLRSSTSQKGEYTIGVTHEGTQEQSYNRRYLDRFLVPVYEVKVDEVPVLKVWKNDVFHLRPEYKKEEKLAPAPLVTIQDESLMLDLRDILHLTRIELIYPPMTTCSPPVEGYVLISIDGNNWATVVSRFISATEFGASHKAQPGPGTFYYLFAGDVAQFVRIPLSKDTGCLLAPARISVYHL